jgi:uncharacterized membrane protein YqgA involved in biofilm formation
MENQVPVTPAAPARQLKTNRSLLKVILLSIITLGIYSLFFYAGIASDVNLLASRYDGKKTMNFWLLFFIITPITAGIGMIVWIHKLCNRMGDELSRRGISYSFRASTYWLWCVLGALIIVGPFIFIHKFAEASNRLAADYNIKG